MWKAANDPFIIARENTLGIGPELAQCGLQRVQGNAQVRHARSVGLHMKLAHFAANRLICRTPGIVRRSDLHDLAGLDQKTIND
jgi:hypothetical protein